MDTGASSYLNDSVTSLSDVLNRCIYPSVSIGDGYTIPVTNSGHSVLPTPHRPLHLNNILITPNIVKILIFVRQFVRDNNCTVEFDAFGFSIKDFMTRRVLLWCDSTGDLYPVTKPSTIPHAFLTSHYTWHQRLGHPGSEVLQRILSRNLISCTKEKPLVLCHACQLGKHVKLPFASYNTLVKFSFDVVHSDLWTSPILSLSGFKYYVLFLDHYSQYVWVYPLVNKSDVFSKFMFFRTFIRTQFKWETKFFQCDHGGEFDNHAFHKLFADNGIQFCFSCPRTSQQNGKSERMIRTINNIIRTLLFQAHLPPNYWVEALIMAIILLNILPSRAIDNELPFTSLFGTTPDYSVLHGTLSCYKARLVANGSTQIDSVDVDETFSPVVKPDKAVTLLIYYCMLMISYSQLLLRLCYSRLLLPSSGYAIEILERAHMANCNPSRTPVNTESKLGGDGDPVSDPTFYQSLTGSLQYLTFTRLDISYAVQQVCLYMHDPWEPHFSALKRILRYAGCPITRRSTSGYYVYLGNNLLSWSSKHQPTLSRSSAEAKYYDVANAVAETCWLRNLLRELHTPLSSATLVYCDNVSAIYLTYNPVQHQHTKHIEIDIHFVHDLVVAGQVRVLHVPSHYQYADIFTKGLPFTLFEEFRTSLSVQCPLAPSVREC
ncbi:ribonuclease H-like domain-containing protein [Tanacetum coccineum]